jgi:hypothetical protein
MSSTQALLRFLALVERELGASDARLELSAHDPPDDAVWAPMAHGFRIVARLEGPHEVEPARARLRSIVESFAGVLAEAALPTLREAPPTVVATLEEALDLLAHRARAESAWVIDDSTPEIWGGSLPHDGFDVDDAVRVARLAATAERLGASLGELARLGEGLRAWLAERDVSPETAQEIERDLDELRAAGAPPDGAILRTLRALATVRSRATSPADQLFVRRFAGIYELVLVFAGAHSELHAEAAVLRALPLIERLVTSLPPRDPVATGAKVAVLRRLRRV